MKNDKNLKIVFFIFFFICCYFEFLNFRINTKILNNLNKKDTIFVEVVNPIEEIITLTTYNPIKAQCDSTPLITANGTKINLEKLKKGEIKYCAVSRDLLEKFPYGSIIYIEGYGEYEVVDTMNKRIKMSIDILQDVSKKGFKKTNIRILKVK